MSNTPAMNSLAIIVSSKDKTLAVARLDAASGELTPSRVVPFPDVEGDNGPSPMAVSPDGRMLYVAFRGSSPAVLSFVIDYGAADLHYVGKAPLSASMAYLSTDRTGRYLFSASYGSALFAVNRIEADGRAGEILESLEAAPLAHCVVPSHGNGVVFVTSVAAGEILRYGFDAETGRVHRLAEPAVRVGAGKGPRHLVFDRAGRFVYVVNQQAGSVDVFAVAADGTFELLQTVGIVADGFAGEPLASDVHLTPNGRFLYASERNSDTIAGFSVDPANGRLTALGKYKVPETPRGFAIDPTGHYLVVLGETCATAAIYRIDRQSGLLQEIARHETGAGPNWVELLPMPAPARS